METIEVFLDKNEPDAFYARIPYSFLNRVHKVGGKWVQGRKVWRFPMDCDLWENFEHQFNDCEIKKDLAFIIGMNNRKKKQANFLEAKKIAEKDEPSDFGVEGISLNGKNPLFNYQRHGVQCGLQVGDGFLIGDVPGLGKAEILDNKVFTPFGRKRIGDIVVGDKVIGSDGLSHNVIGVYPQGLKPVYKITFNDGYSIECAEEHLWFVFDRCKNSYNVLTTGEMLDKELVKEKNGIGRNYDKVYKYSTYYKKSDGGNKWQIPIVKPIQFERKDMFLVDPYLMGVLIGDGCFTNHCVTVDENENDFEEIFNPYLQSGCYNARELKKPNAKSRKIAFTINSELKQLGLFGKHSYDKFIPECYKYASVEDRLALLQGLMDTDGHCMKSNKDIFSGTEFSTVSERLSDDVAELVQSLGGIVRKHSKKPFYTKNGVHVYCKTAYRLNIKMPSQLIPFRLKRKISAYHIPQKYDVARFIKDISYVGEKECVCIAVDAPDHLYVTEHCIVTHNTIQGLAIAIERKNRGEIKNCLIVCPASLKYNWLDEIHKFTKEKALVIGHKAKNKEEREKQWIADGYFFKIVNYELVARDLYVEPKKTDNRISCANVVLKSFDMCIWDECQYLKHHSSARTQACRAIQAKYRIGLSGTPIDGKLEEIHSIFQILKPGLFVNKTQFMARYAEYDYFGSVKGYHRVNEVRDKIAPYYLRRLKEVVFKDLPPKIFKDLHVELSDKNMKDYKRIANGKSDITAEAAAAELVIRARQFLDFPEIIGMHNSSDKYKVFKELMDSLVMDNNEKTIVFTQYTNTIKYLIQNLKSDGYKHILVIDGSVPSEERQEICKKFNGEDKPYILIMSDAGCTGLNLQEAKNVVHYTDNFSPAVMQQRNDRAHRATTKHTVVIYRFICDGTIDEHVRGILGQKMAINNAMLDEHCSEFSIGDMSALELMSCL